MKDLDFDELDQAVSSVLGGDAPEEKKETPKTAPQESHPVAEKQLPAKDASDPEPAKAPVTSASPAVRRRGQFLDMVHPASDMTGRTPVSPAARKRISPVSTNLAAPPTSEERAEKTAAVAAAESEPEPTSFVAPAVPERPVEKPVAAEPAPVKADEDITAFDAPAVADKKEVAWPDPLDLVSGGNLDDKADTTPANGAPEESVDDTPEPKPELTTDISSTPFMTDTKVDKRPLGAFGSTEPELQPPAEDAALTTPSAALDEQRIPEVTPPELQPDVVSVESADKEFATEADQPEETTEVEKTPAANSGLSESIPQQYRTPADAPAATPHPIFDTDEYHQPLLPAAGQKKKHGWLIVLIILALLVVGSALGYFAFVAGF